MRTLAATVLALAGTLAWVCIDARAQARPKPPSSTANPPRTGQEYHIEVNTLPGCFFSGCAEPVRAGNVRVTAGGVRVPVRVAQPPGSGVVAGTVPVHMLVAFAPSVERPSDAQLLASLRRVLAAGWLVSVCRADGTFTDYGHAPELRRALAEHADAPKMDAGLDTISGAIDEMRAEPGYRVVLVDLGGRSDDKFVRWLASEADRLSPIYVSDGGKAQMPYSPSTEGGYDGRDNPLVGAESKKERAYTDGVFHEFVLAQAIRDAFADTRFDFDLRFHAPVSIAADRRSQADVPRTRHALALRTAHRSLHR